MKDYSWGHIVLDSIYRTILSSRCVSFSKLDVSFLALQVASSTCLVH